MVLSGATGINRLPLVGHCILCAKDCRIKYTRINFAFRAELTNSIQNEFITVLVRQRYRGHCEWKLKLKFNHWVTRLSIGIS